MPYANRFENAKATDRVAQGDGGAAQPTQPFSPQSTFRRMLILDVVSDPANIVDEKKIAYWDVILKVTNMNYAAVLPRNTIIAQAIRDDTEKPMFVFPFFPSHLALPCKPGETVWAMSENPDAKFSDIAYWFCRVTEPYHVDDVNHTHAARIQDTSNFPTLKARHSNDGKSSAVYELRNGIAITKGSERSTKASSFYIPGSEDIFEKLITDTDASKLMQYESVPRFRKRPGDVVLEGSNNSLVVLGTDRVGPISSLTVNENQNNSVSPEKISDDNSKGSAGSIDVVVGRGQAPSTSGKIADTVSISKNSSAKGPAIKQELNKEFDNLSPFEGDPDLRNDRSRILLSQRTKADRNFGLDSYNEHFKSVAVGNPHEMSDIADGNAAIVIKSDKVRLIARSDAEIVVTGYKTDKNVAGNEVITEKNDPSEWASIMITADGSIVFKPSKKGYIKLGSEKADRAILCTSTPAIAADGKVTSTPIIQPLGTVNPGMATVTVKIGDDMAKTSGTFASKILVDVTDPTYPGPVTKQDPQAPKKDPNTGSSSEQAYSTADVTSTPSKSSTSSSTPYPKDMKIPPGAILTSDLSGYSNLSNRSKDNTSSYALDLNPGRGGPTTFNPLGAGMLPATNDLENQIKSYGLINQKNDYPETQPPVVSVIESSRNQDTISEQMGKKIKGLDPRYNKKNRSV